MGYLPHTADQVEAMLNAIGVRTIDDLFSGIPSTARLNRSLHLPAPLAEMDLSALVASIGRGNRSASDLVCFLGGGAYDHFVPAVVDALAGRSEFVTAYTPYQAEASQGSLQAFFEFQTLICQLSGLEVTNSSLYEGSSAVAEAVMMALAVGGRNGPVLMAPHTHPHHISVSRTYLANLGTSVETLAASSDRLDLASLASRINDQTPCVVVQHPNVLGNLEEVDEISRICKEKGVLFIVSYNPVSLGILKRPGDYGADVAVAEGQSLGSPLAFGGPYLGLLSCRGEHLRKIPGRLVGQTVDRHGKRCWVLALQTREQHIRREKATSNICTNQGLYALRAAIHLAALGPVGLRETALMCLERAHETAAAIRRTGAGEPLDGAPWFNEFVVRLPDTGPVAERVVEAMAERGFLAGFPLGRWYPGRERDLLVAVTERRTTVEIDAFAAALAAVVKSG